MAPNPASQPNAFGDPTHSPMKFTQALADQQVWQSAGRQEDRCRRMVDAHPMALILLDQKGEIDLANKQAERIFGYAARELLGGPIDRLIPGAGRLHRAALRRGFLAHAECHALTDGADPSAHRKDGSVFPVEIDMSTIETAEGTMVVTSIMDVTARREAGAAREKQALDLAQSNADLQEFAYIASHDLRAPVRAISLLADWIAEDIQATATPDTLDNLRLMRQRAGRLEMLLDGLLSYTSVGRVKAKSEPVELAVLVRHIVESLAPPSGFTVTFTGSVAVVETPRVPLEHVLQNLIANAIRHHDRAAGQVQVHAARFEGGTEFRVQDDGPGIAPAYHKRIFAIFQTLKSRDDCETSGVGLSIVQKTVEGRGGRVWIESEPPRRGTAFLFTWPDKIK